VNKTVEILSGLAVKKEINLTAEIDKNIYINADDSLILQVFNNLVANSVKFTPNGGSIIITAEKLLDEQKVEFRVKDTGVGIEAEDLDKLFVVDKKFTTLGTDGEKGTGLGLSLVREIIERHNGNIGVESKVGEGTEFIFKLPISTPSILIYDTSDTERVLYSKLLESITESIQILQAGNEEEALFEIKEKMPMLIILENNLVEMTAADFVDTLAKSGLVYKPSFLILTKEYSEDLHQSYKDKGIDNVFRKPFDFKEFKVALDKLTGKN
ncbi:MAG: ATP-binding protein, partial [Melioribacteraceae bacterium]|nr:ATP-binding protein [Melioribacteraceae bacterium]